MLFDLKGRRRRVVQATYLMLAILMGGGLVFFGIGGDVSGGLFDAFSDRSTSGNSIIEDRVDDNEKKLESNPNDKTALRQLVRDRYQLANEELREDNTYTDEGKKRLAGVDEAWQRYVAVVRKPEPALASLMIQVYSQGALNKPAEAARAAELLAEANPSSQAYLQLVQYAAQAGQKRKANLAGMKAIELAPKRERSTVRAFVEQAKNPTPAQTGQPAQ